MVDCLSICIIEQNASGKKGYLYAKINNQCTDPRTSL